MGLLTLARTYGGGTAEGAQTLSIAMSRSTRLEPPSSSERRARSSRLRSSRASSLSSALQCAAPCRRKRAAAASGRREMAGLTAWALAPTAGTRHCAEGKTRSAPKSDGRIGKKFRKRQLLLGSYQGRRVSEKFTRTVAAMKALPQLLACLQLAPLGRSAHLCGPLSSRAVLSASPLPLRLCAPDTPQQQPAPLDRLRARVRSRSVASAPFDPASVLGYLNSEHGGEASTLLAWSISATEIGKTAARRNAWSRGSWVPRSARALSLSTSSLELEVEIEERGKPTRSTIHTSLPFDAPCDTADALRAAFVELCNEAKLAAISAEMLTLPGSSDGWSLPEDMWLNATPNSRSVRQMFYNDVSEALQAALPRWQKQYTEPRKKHSKTRVLGV